MTITIQVTIQGNYKVPIKVVRPGHPDEEVVITGRNAGGPVSRHFTHFHGDESTTQVTVGPEVFDDGKEEEAPAPALPPAIPEAPPAPEVIGIDPAVPSADQSSENGQGPAPEGPDLPPAADEPPAAP